MGAWRGSLHRPCPEGQQCSRRLRLLPALAIQAPYLPPGKADSPWSPATSTLGRQPSEPPDGCTAADKCPCTGHPGRLNVTTLRALCYPAHQKHFRSGQTVMDFNLKLKVTAEAPPARDAASILVQ
ncbi:hypothetical protein SRHO_G00316210 [Serrasalmus rhombeus]